MDAAWIVREADMAEKESWLDIPENTGACERRLAKACARAYSLPMFYRNREVGLTWSSMVERLNHVEAEKRLDLEDFFEFLWRDRE